MRFLTALCFVTWLACLGCNRQPSSELADSTQAMNDQVVGSGSPTQTDSPRTERADASDNGQNAGRPMDYGEWLPLSKGINSRIAEVYPSVVRAALAGEPDGHVKLADLSQQIALQAASRGDEGQAYAFFGQAGKALRRAIGQGVQGLSADNVSNIFYNEACALAQAGDVDAAMAAIADAIQNGFHNFALLARDGDLEAVRATEGFADKLAEWKRAATEKLQAVAREELARGETFPFELAATDIHGNAQSLSALKGSVVIVDVWGTWCPPCRAEVPSFIQLQTQYADQGLQMLGLNYERGSSAEVNLQSVLDYVEESGINYPCILGDRATQAQIPGFSGYPTTLFIDRSGKVRLKVVGAHDYAYLEAIVMELLAEPSPSSDGQPAV